MIPRQVILHTGTHKTGTKALQVFLAANRQRLERVGIHYPILGRFPMSDEMFTPGHHKVPMEFFADGVSPIFDEMLSEIDHVNAPTVVISSEEFQHMLNRPEAMAIMAAAFAKRGYALRPVVYFRAQPYYAESLYAELAKGLYTQDLVSFFEQIVATGSFEPAQSGRLLHFEYARVIDVLDGLAGPGATIVRAYHPEREPEFVFNDFLRIVGKLRGELRVEGLQNPLPRANESITFAQLLIAIYRIIRPQEGELPADVSHWFNELPPLPDAQFHARFSLLTYADIERFLERFAQGNRTLNERYDIDIPFTGPADLPSPADPRFELARIHRDYLALAVATWSAG